jgi:hypothetical protein
MEAAGYSIGNIQKVTISEEGTNMLFRVAAISKII